MKIWGLCIDFYVAVNSYSIQFSSVQLLSLVRLFATPGIAACQASLSITNSWSSPKLMSIELVIPSNHLILCRPLLLLPPIPPSFGVFSNESPFIKCLTCLRYIMYIAYYIQTHSLHLSSLDSHFILR